MVQAYWHIGREIRIRTKGKAKAGRRIFNERFIRLADEIW
jgi:hypothetical protein